MNILTDILSLIRRGVFTKVANPEDVIVLGVNEQPEMTGVASPIPYKSVKLIKVKDLKIAPAFCNNVNTDLPDPRVLANVFQKQEIDPVTNVCTNYFRTLKSLSTNLSISESLDNDYVEFITTGEPNTAANLGTGAGLYANKTGETLNTENKKATVMAISKEDFQEIVKTASVQVPSKTEMTKEFIELENKASVMTLNDIKEYQPQIYKEIMGQKNSSDLTSDSLAINTIKIMEEKAPSRSKKPSESDLDSEKDPYDQYKFKKEK